MEEKELTVIKNIIDTCSKQHFDSVFAPLADLPTSSSKAEMISYCLNTELGAYG
mgnify:FL=1